MSEEQKIVFRQETFNDLAVRELAKGRAACICKIQFKRCDKAECAHCPVGQEYWNCYNAMSDYDKQRLTGYISNEYAEQSRHPEHFMKYKDFVNYQLRYIFGALLTFVLLFVIAAFMLGPCDKPNMDPVSPETDFRIINCITQAQERVYDMNKDGKINCVDYAVMFKVTWDELYPDLAGKCQIIRNFGPKMNHLFVHVWDVHNYDIEIEPWATYPQRYRMYENWTGVYDPKYNNYGETETWLRECGVR